MERKRRTGTSSKLHALTHSFDDIIAKGATRNYNTKPNEKLHGPLKKAYMRTNYKDVAAQVSYLQSDMSDIFVLMSQHTRS